MQLNLLPSLLTMLEPVDLVPQTLDIVHAALQYGALVWPHVSYDLVERIVGLREEGPEFFDAVVYVETTAAFNWKEGDDQCNVKPKKERKKVDKVGEVKDIL